MLLILINFCQIYSVKRNTYLPPSRASSAGKGVGISLKPGRSTKTDKRKNSIGHTILIPTTRYKRILWNDNMIRIYLIRIWFIISDIFIDNRS